MTKSDAQVKKRQPPVVIQWSSRKGNRKGSRGKSGKKQMGCTWAKLGVSINSTVSPRRRSTVNGRHSHDGVADADSKTAATDNRKTLVANGQGASSRVIPGDSTFHDMNAILQNMPPHKRHLALQFVRELDGMKVRGVLTLSALLSRMKQSRK